MLDEHCKWLPLTNPDQNDAGFNVIVQSIENGKAVLEYMKDFSRHNQSVWG